MDVLAVVEDQERPLVGQVLAEGGDRPVRGVVLEPERREHRLRHELGILDRRELHEPHAVWVLPGALPSGPEGELGLAHAAHTGERQQPGRRQGPLEVGQTLTASHEARQFDWQVAGTGVGSGGRQGLRSLTDLPDAHSVLDAEEIGTGLRGCPDGIAEVRTDGGARPLKVDRPKGEPPCARS